MRMLEAGREGDLALEALDRDAGGELRLRDAWPDLVLIGCWLGGTQTPTYGTSAQGPMGSACAVAGP